MNRELQRVVEALDAGPMGPRLVAALGAGSTHVLDGKYEPGLKALVLYAHDGRLVRGDVQLDGTDLRDGLMVEPGVRLSVFPHDPGLPTLPDALDRARLGAALGAVCTDVVLLRYRPGKRATVRIALGAGGHAVIGTGGHAVIGKVYHDATKAAAVASEAAARAGAAQRSRHLCLAPTVAHVDELRLVVQAIVRGAPLGALVEHERGPFPGALDGVRRAVEGLVELHEGPVVSTRERPVRRELQRFAQRAARIESVHAPAGGALGALAERLLDLEASMPAGPVGLVHGDCKPSQFLLRDDDRVALLDLDHLGTGDQAGDVGTFAATLAQLAVRHELAGAPTAHRRAMAALEQAAVDTYLERRALPGLRPRVDWHIAVALERKALRAFARAPLSPLATALAGEGHRRLDSLLGVAA
jgi:hypothetical protein